MSCATHELIKYANQLGELLTVDRNEKNFLYTVHIVNVWYREKKSFLKLSISGQGFTIEDACSDYLRKSRGELLIHAVTNKEASPI